MTSKFALVIANTEYQDASFAKLTAPGKDAEEFAQVLRDGELAAFDDVQVLINEGEGKTRRAIARFFGERKPADLLLLYFSGHGVRNEQGQLFLAANDTEISILEATGIPAEFITRAMNNSRSQRQLLILDCCNSGAFAHGSKSASGVGKSMGIASAFEGDGYGRVVLTATDATQFAWEGDKVIGDTQKSVFTHFLIEGLKGEADRDSDGRIHVDELYDYAYEQVVRRTPKQTPGKWSYRQQGDMILRENLKPRDVKPSPLPSDLLEMLAHPNSGVRRAGIQDLISLLDGKHLGLVRDAQEKLREIAAEDDSLTLRRTANETLAARGIEVPQLALVETPKEEKKVEKPAHVPSFSIGEGRRHPEQVEAVRDKQPRQTSQPKKTVPAFNQGLLGGIAGGFILIVLLILGGASYLNYLSSATEDPNGNVVFTAAALTVQAQMTQSEQTKTPPPSATLIAATPTLGIGSSMISNKDGMTLIYVPAGEFKMGSDNGDSDEKPVHTVTLDAFWIDQTEVTNSMYAKCVKDGKCDPPSSSKSYTQDNYYGNSMFDDYPVIYVSWNNAKTYCAWADRRLPTEAEWEKGARGTDGRTYPWGDNAPNNNLLNYDGAVGDTTEVSKYPNGASPYGALDMAGNVWEWVADWYDANYYATLGENVSNPHGPASGQDRVLRGGAWDYVDSYVRSSNRHWYSPTYPDSYIGFRCSRSP